MIKIKDIILHKSTLKSIEAKYLAGIVDNGTTVITIPTPKGWKCKRKGCTANYFHTHGIFTSLTPKK